MAVKTNLARTAILETRLRPRCKYITRSEYRLGRDNGFDCIPAVEAELPVSGTIRQSKGKISSSSAAVVNSGVLPTNGHRDQEGCDLDNINKQIEVAREAYVRATINQRASSPPDLHVRRSFSLKAEHPG